VRRRFTFYHELMHHRIEHDDEMLSLFADATSQADEALMERLCDVGAAELLLPGADVQRLVQRDGLAPSTMPV
jgi:Zn-dependent peptidase ImmA (M78 family)